MGAQEGSQKDYSALKPESLKKYLFVICRTPYVLLYKLSDHYMGGQQTYISRKIKMAWKHLSTLCLTRENKVVLNKNSERKQEKSSQEG